MLAVYNRRNCFKRVATIADRACLASIRLHSVWNHTERKKKPTCRVNNKGGERLVWEESERITGNWKTNRDKIRTICGLVSVIADNIMRKRWYLFSVAMLRGSVFDLPCCSSKEVHDIFVSPQGCSLLKHGRSFKERPWSRDRISRRNHHRTTHRYSSSEIRVFPYHDHDPRELHEALDTFNAFRPTKLARLNFRIPPCGKCLFLFSVCLSLSLSLSLSSLATWH